MDAAVSQVKIAKICPERLCRALKTRISGSNTIYYTLGNDIYIGWVAALLALISGALFICSGCREEEDDDEYDDPMVRFKLIN